MVTENITAAVDHMTLTSLATTATSKYNCILKYVCFGRVLKRSRSLGLSAHLIQVKKLLLVTFYLNGGLHAVSIGKPYERMSNFWTVRFLTTT